MDRFSFITIAGINSVVAFYEVCKRFVDNLVEKAGAFEMVRVDLLINFYAEFYANNPTFISQY